MDWSEIVTNLLDSGLSEYTLADEIGVSQPTIHRLKTGDQKEPKHSVGEKLKAIHLERVSQRQAS